MQMKDGLPRGLVAVHDDAVAVIRQTFRCRYVACRGIELTDERLVLSGQVIDRRNVFPRNNQNVSWRLGVNVAEGQSSIRLMDDVRRYFSRDNFAEQTVDHFEAPPLIARLP